MRPLSYLENALPDAAREIHANNREKGFQEIPDIEELAGDCRGNETIDKIIAVQVWCADRLDAMAIGLIHSEVSEMMEARRCLGWWTKPSEHLPGRSAFVEEGADVIIRVLDLFARLRLETQLAQAIPEKVAFNRGRPYKHGKVF